MRKLINVLSIVLGLVATAYAVYEFYAFVAFPNPDHGRGHMWMAIGAAVVACVCGFVYFMRHIKDEEEAESEIHIF